MGWLGWTEAQTLDTTIPAILTAYEGRMDMLKAIFGSSDEAPVATSKASEPKLSLGQALKALAMQRKPPIDGDQHA